MEIITENPFVGFGQPVKDSRLIGQEHLIQKIQRNLLNGSSSFLVGLPRSGKTSVAKEVLKRIKSEHSDISCTTIFLSAVTDESDFYHDVIADLFPGGDIFGGENDAGKKYDLFRYHLREQGSKGFSGIVVIDEFDSVFSGKFSEPYLFINRLCELVTFKEDYHLTFLFLSSRPLLRYADPQTTESGLAGLCPQFYMKMLSKTDVEKLLRNVHITESQIRNTIFKITGGHPFLTEALLYHSLDYAEENSLPLSASLIKSVRKQDNCSAVFGQYYINIKKLLSLWDDLQLWDRLCDLVIGPLLQPPSNSICKILEHYGLIDEQKKCFSEDFHEFLSNQIRSIPLWDIISEVEKLLRKLLKVTFEKKYKSDWVNDLKSKDKFFSKKFEELEKIMKREDNPLADSSDILEYTYFDDIKALISHCWDLFQKVFGDSKSTFCERMQKIVVVRNSVAHNRLPRLIPDEDQILAQKACEELKKRLEEWEENRNCNSIDSIDS